MPCGTLQSSEVRDETIHDYRVYDNGSVDINTYNPTNVFKKLKSTTGNCIPHFHARKRKGELLPHTKFFQQEYEWESSGSYSVRFSYGASNIRFTRTRSPSYPMDEADIIPDWEALKTEFKPDFEYMVQAAAAKVYERGHDTLTFISEIHKTRQMFVDLVKKIVRYKRSSEPFDLQSRVRETRSLWVEGRYGWRTLIYDIQDLQKALESLSEIQRKRISERSGMTETFTNITVENLNWSSGPLTRTYTDDFQVGRRGSITADIRPPHFRFNIVSTAWELTTLSFVLDWIYNVGQALSAINFHLLAEQYAASGGFQIYLQRHVAVSTVSWNTYFSGTISQEATYIGSMVERVPMSVPLRPLTTFNIDDFKVWDLLAILSQKFK